MRAALAAIIPLNESSKQMQAVGSDPNSAAQFRYTCGWGLLKGSPVPELIADNASLRPSFSVTTRISENGEEVASPILKFRDLNNEKISGTPGRGSAFSLTFSTTPATISSSVVANS